MSDPSAFTFYSKYRHLLLYGVALALLIFALRWIQWKFLIVDYSLDIYIGLIAVFFTMLGIWVAKQLTRPKIQEVVVEREVYVSDSDKFVLNETELKRLNLSNREREVLQLLARGCRNAEIAEQLFLSLSTVKTHVSSIFVKLDVKSRVQAVDKAKRLNIVP